MRKVLTRVLSKMMKNKRVENGLTRCSCQPEKEVMSFILLAPASAHDCLMNYGLHIKMKD